MTDHRTLGGIAHEACILASLVEGLSVLCHQNDGGTHAAQSLLEKRASNALDPAIDVVIERAWALTDALEQLEMEQRKAGQSPRGNVSFKEIRDHLHEVRRQE